MVCVSSISSSVPVSRVSRRSASWKPGSGSTMQQLVSTGSVMTQATSPGRQRLSSAGMSLNSTIFVWLGQVAELAGQARSVDRLAVLQPHEGLVDGAVIAAVEDQDLCAGR